MYTSMMGQEIMSNKLSLQARSMSRLMLKWHLYTPMEGCLEAVGGEGPSHITRKRRLLTQNNR
jgi:hypothetical protein